MRFMVRSYRPLVQPHERGAVKHNKEAGSARVFRCAACQQRKLCVKVVQYLCVTCREGRLG